MSSSPGAFPLPSLAETVVWPEVVEGCESLLGYAAGELQLSSSIMEGVREGKRVQTSVCLTCV